MMKFFREHTKALQVIAFLVIFVIIIANFASLTKADTAYTAFDLLGQFDGTPSYTERYTSSNQNNDGSGVANAIGFSNPYDVITDSAHNRLFVCDTDNYRILVFNTDANGIPIDVVADNVIGQPDFTSNSYLSISSTTFFGCTSLAYDSVGDRLFVADYSNQRVLVFDTSTITNGEGAINVIGQVDFISSGLYTDQAGLYAPSSLAYDETTHLLYVGQIIVQNLVSRISVFDVTSITDGEDAVHVLGQPDYTPLTYIPPDDSSFIGVGGMTIDTVSQLLYVSDDIGNRVLVFNVNAISDGEPAVHVLGQPDFTTVSTSTTASGLNNPHGVTYNPNTNRLFVADEGNSRVSIFNTATIIDGEDAVNVIGQATFTSGANVTRAGLSSPRGISIDVTNKILFLADSGSYRVTYYDLNNLADGMNATGVLGQIDISYTFGSTANFSQSIKNSGTDTYVSGAGFSSPSTTALDTTHHRLFVSDAANNRVLVYILDSTNQLVDHTPDAVLGAVSLLAEGVSSISASTFLAGPGGLAYDDVHERLFVSDALANRVLVFDTTTITNGEDAVAVIGQSDFISGTVYSVTAGIRMPQGLDYYTDGVNERLFVSDYGNNKVAVYDVASITNGESATGYLGTPTTNTYPTCDTATSANICGTYDVKIDPIRMLAFVVDGFNHRVLVYDIATITNSEPATYVLGQANFTDTIAATTVNGFNRPTALLYDTENKLLFVSEFTNNRVLIFDTATLLNNMSAVAVIGQSDFISGTSGVSNSAISYPQFGSFDQENNIFYLPDGYNNRVLLFHFVFLNTSTIASSATIGANYSQTFSTTNSQGTTSLSLTSGTLPPGLTLGATSLSGTPTTAGTYNFTVRAIDTLGVSTFYSNQRSFTITVTGSGGGGGGPSWCQDSSAINYGGSPPCVYANPDLCLNIPGVQVTVPSGLTHDASNNCTSSEFCFDSRSSNYGEPLPCTYTTTIPLCTSASATNFGGPLPCIFTPPPPPPPPPATCQDTTATNVGGALPCVYTPPPPPQLCSDATAENFGGPVPCTYVVTPPVVTSLPPPPAQVSATVPVAPLVNEVDPKIPAAGATLVILLGLIEYSYLPKRYRILFFIPFGLRKRAHSWGVVYDAVTKIPLAKVSLELLNKEGEIVATASTDSHGRYTFLVPPGIYAIRPQKTGYAFPALTLGKVTSDFEYTDLYFGNFFDIKNKNDYVIKNIPLDPKVGSQEKIVLHEHQYMRFSSRANYILHILIDVLFALGFILTIFGLIMKPQLSLSIIFIAFTLMLVYRELAPKPKRVGHLFDATKKSPLSGAIFHVFSATLGNEVTRKITDLEGRFYCQVPNGWYYVVIDTKTKGKSYTPVYESQVFQVKKGIIRGEWYI
jgi:DNA-binding beta-propeller fold protein YncE